MKYPYDPAKAKQLLAEAGYPNGFDTELVTYAPPQLGAAVQNYLKAVGINLRIQQLQIGAAIQLAEAGKAPLYSGSWGSNSVNDVSAFMPYCLGGIERLRAGCRCAKPVGRGWHHRRSGGVARGLFGEAIQDRHGAC